MLDQIWNAILQFTSQLVIPDWGSLIALLPIGIAVLVAIVIIWMFRRLRAAPPARRGKQRIEPKPPADVHMPGPSYAPAFAALGAALTMLGLVFGGPILILGVVALVLTLLYWLREALRIYDREQGDTVRALPAEIHEGPPPGVHMPGPSFRPFIGALGTFFLFLGLVFGGWLLLAGVIILDPDPRRVARRCPQGIRQDHRGGPDRPPLEHPQATRAEGPAVGHHDHRRDGLRGAGRLAATVVRERWGPRCVRTADRLRRARGIGSARRTGRLRGTGGGQLGNPGFRRHHG